MNMKDHILSTLREQFDRWEDLLTGQNEVQINAPLLPSPWSTKDNIARSLSFSSLLTTITRNITRNCLPVGKSHESLLPTPAYLNPPVAWLGNHRHPGNYSLAD